LRTYLLIRIIGLKKAKVTGGTENYKMRGFILYTLHQILLGWSDQGGQDE